MRRFLVGIAGGAGRRLLLGLATAALVAGLVFELPVAFASASPSSSTARVGAPARLPARSRVVGKLAQSTALKATVVLKPRDPQALAAYAAAVSTPGSSVYKHYLTVSQFASRFGAEPSEIGAVQSALRAKGLRVDPATRNGLSIPIRGTAGQLSTAFATSFNQVKLASGRIAYANTAAPQFPADVAGTIQGVAGLSTVDEPQPVDLQHVGSHATSRAIAPHVVTGGPQPCSAASNDTGTYTADQLAYAYDLSGLYQAGDEGAGQTIALYELTSPSTGVQAFNTNDISVYQSCYGTSTSISGVGVAGASVTTSGAGGGEVTLDVEDLIGLAPKANIIVYTGDTSTDGGADYDTYAAIMNADAAKVVSVSYGACEPNSNDASAAEDNALFEEAATQGQSVLVASGDSGSEGCDTAQLAVQTPSSSPFATAVGGTRVSSIGAPPTTPPTESVWNDLCNGNPCGGGGGISTFWNMPSYQSGASAALNVTNNSYASGTPCAATGGDCREVPDVSADADPATGYAIYNGGWLEVGGTSAAAPTWAALIALANASTSCAGNDIGFANPDLYSLAGSGYATYFNDVTQGNNDIDSSTFHGTYPAGTGYDMASGLGTPIGSALAAGLCGIASTSTGPPTVNALATVALPAGTSSMPTGVALDPTNHDVYITESKSNGVAKITGSGGTTFSPTATAISLSGLNFPDDLSVDSSGSVYASDFCIGSATNVCAGRSASTTTVVSQTSAQDSFNAFYTADTCPYPSGLAAASGYLLVNCAGSGYIRACPLAVSFGCGTQDAYQGDDQLPSGAVPSGMAVVPGGFMPIPPGAPSIAGVVVADAANNTVNLFGYGFSSANGNQNYDDTYSPSPSLASSCDPAGVAVGPQLTNGAVKTATVYVACPGNGTIEVGELWSNGTSSSSEASLTGFHAISLPTSGIKTPSPYGVAINSAGTTLAVTDSANNDVVIYPSVSGESLGQPGIVDTGSVPDGVVVDGGNVFVANEGSGTVTVADPPAKPASGAVQRAAQLRGPRDNRLAVSDTPLLAPVPGRFSPPVHRTT